MPTEFSGRIEVDIRDSEPDWQPYVQPTAPDGAPNVLYIVWDDVGYAAMDVFGGPIETPNMRRLADHGLRYSNFHTTALCSPTRSSLLTGRNATSNGMACITEGATDGTKARYAFVYGDFRRVHRSGMIACVYRAAEWRHKDVERAAYELLQELDRAAGIG